MLDLISHQMRASLMESGKLSLMLQNADIVSIIEDAIYHQSFKTLEVGTEIQLDYANRPMVNMDIAYMQEVFSQLFMHVIKQTQPESKIWVSVEVDKKTVKISITYIAAQEEPWHLGNEWPIGHSFSTLIKPSMSLTKKLVEGHGGTLWVSKLGKDSLSSCSIELPLAERKL